MLVFGAKQRRCSLTPNVGVAPLASLISKTAAADYCSVLWKSTEHCRKPDNFYPFLVVIKSKLFLY